VTLRADLSSSNFRLKRSSFHIGLILILSTRQKWSPSGHSRFTSDDRPFATYWISGRESPTVASVDASEQRQITCPFRELNQVHACYVTKLLPLFALLATISPSQVAGHPLTATAIRLLAQSSKVILSSFVPTVPS